MQTAEKINLTSLNNEQRKAVEYTCGPLLIAAGPGSGKTRTIVYRTLYMINEKGVDAEEILLITFTKKAANEMRERVASHIKNGGIPFIGTFHLLCLEILRKYGFKISINRNFNIYDPADQLDLMQNLIKDAKKKSLKDILNRI